MTSPLKRRARASGLAAASALALTAASVFGLVSAAQADYVSPEELSTYSGAGWIAAADFEGDVPLTPDFEECSVIFPENGGHVGYTFAEGEQPTGLEEVSGTIESFYASVTQGGGVLEVVIDRELSGDTDYGISDIFLEIPVGVHGIDLDSVVEVDDSPDLALPADATVQDVLDALENSGDVYYIIGLNFVSDAASEVQWLAFGSETYWFGTDAEWFLNDPSCGTIVPDPTPEPQPAPDSNPTPNKPVRVETGL